MDVKKRSPEAIQVGTASRVWDHFVKVVTRLQANCQSYLVLRTEIFAVGHQAVTVEVVEVQVYRALVVNEGAPVIFDMWYKHSEDRLCRGRVDLDCDDVSLHDKQPRGNGDEGNPLVNIIFFVSP